MFLIFLIFMFQIQATNSTILTQLIEKTQNNKKLFSLISTGGIPPYQYVVSGLPQGTTMIDNQIAISDSTLPGNYVLNVSAVDQNSQKAWNLINLTIGQQKSLFSNNNQQKMIHNNEGSIPLMPKSLNSSKSINLVNVSSKIPINSISTQKNIQQVNPNKISSNFSINTTSTNPPPISQNSPQPLPQKQPSLIFSNQQLQQLKADPQQKLSLQLPQNLSIQLPTAYNNNKALTALDQQQLKISLMEKLRNLTNNVENLKKQTQDIKSERVNYTLLINQNQKDINEINGKINSYQLMLNHSRSMIITYEHKVTDTTNRCQQYFINTQANNPIQTYTKSTLPSTLSSTLNQSPNSQTLLLQCQSLLNSYQSTLTNYRKTEQNYFNQIISLKNKVDQAIFQLDWAKNAINDIDNIIRIKNVEIGDLDKQIAIVNGDIERNRIYKQDQEAGGVNLIADVINNGNDTNVSGTNSISKLVKNQTIKQSIINNNSINPTNTINSQNNQNTIKIISFITDIVPTQTSSTFPSNMISYTIIHPYSFTTISNNDISSIGQAYNLNLRRANSQIDTTDNQCIQQSSAANGNTQKIEMVGKLVSIRRANNDNSFCVQTTDGQVFVISVNQCTVFKMQSIANKEDKLNNVFTQGVMISISAQLWKNNGKIVATQVKCLNNSTYA